MPATYQRVMARHMYSIVYVAGYLQRFKDYQKCVVPWQECALPSVLQTGSAFICRLWRH